MIVFIYSFEKTSVLLNFNQSQRSVVLRYDQFPCIQVIYCIVQYRVGPVLVLPTVHDWPVVILGWAQRVSRFFHFRTCGIRHPERCALFPYDEKLKSHILEGRVPVELVDLSGCASYTATSDCCNLLLKKNGTLRDDNGTSGWPTQRPGTPFPSSSS